MQFESRKLFSRGDLFAPLLLVLGFIANVAFGADPVIVTLPSHVSGSEIQKALDALPPSGEVILRPGTYEISAPLMLRHADQTLSGSGSNTVLRLADGANCPVVILGRPMSVSLVPLTHLRLANLLIDGNRLHQKTEHWRVAFDGGVINNNGIHIWNTTGAVVEHVATRRCRSGGLVTAGVTHLLVKDFDSYGNQFDGLACYQTSDSQFDDLRLHDNVAAGISLDMDFNHNFIMNAVLSGNDLGIFMRNSRSNLFKGITISKSRHDGIFMAEVAEPTAKGWRVFPNTECTGNDFENLIINDSHGTAFQVNDASCTNNIISGAHFLRNMLGGLVQPTTKPVSLREVAGR